jgi:hypothetical protein
MVSFFFSFFVAVAIYSTKKANKAGSMCHSAIYIFLDVYELKVNKPTAVLGRKNFVNLLFRIKICHIK